MDIPAVKSAVPIGRFQPLKNSVPKPKADRPKMEDTPKECP